MLQATRSIPIVFPVISDPVAAGVVDSLSRPGGNVTGFLVHDYSLSGKWLELLKQIAPSVRRVAVIREFSTPSAIGQFGVIQALAPALGVEISSLNWRASSEFESAIATFARSADGGLIVTSSALATIHRALLVQLVAQHKLPTVYSERFFAAAGGLISYGPNYLDQYRHAANYVDRILKGEKPSDLPVQMPTKFELIINLKTAKTLGLTVPATLLARADEVIE